MITAYVRIENDEVDWFDGPCEFPVLPPIGGTIKIIDRNANMHELSVNDVVVQGVRASIRKELPNTYRELSITLICGGF